MNTKANEGIAITIASIEDTTGLAKLEEQLRELVLPAGERGESFGFWSIPRAEFDIMDFESFAKSWEDRGVYVEIENIENDEVGAKYTNADRPIENVSGLYFKAWGERLERIYAKSEEEIAGKFKGHIGLEILKKAYVNPGVWVGPSQEPTYYSEKATHVLLDNAMLVARLVECIAEKYGQTDKIGTYALPATLIALGDTLSKEYIETLLGIAKSTNKEHREDFFAYFLPAVVSVLQNRISHDQLVTIADSMMRLEKSMPKKMHTPLWSQDTTYLVFDEHNDSKMREAVVRYMGEMVTSAGESFNEETILIIGKFPELIAADTHPALTRLLPALFARNERPMTNEMLEQCLTIINEFVTLYKPSKHEHQLFYTVLPELTQKISYSPDTLERVKYVCAKLTTFIQETNHPHVHVENLLSHWVQNTDSALISVSGFERVLVALKRIDAVCPREKSVILGTFLGTAVHNIDTPLTTEDFEKYAETIEAMPTLQIEAILKKHDGRALTFVVYESKHVYSPEYMRQFLLILKDAKVGTVKIAADFYACVDGDMTPEDLKAFILLTEETFELCGALGNTYLLQAMEDVIGHVGYGNDSKPAKEALILGQAFLTYAKTHRRALREVTNKVTYTDYRGKHQFSEVLLRRYVKSGGRVTARTLTSLQGKRLYP